MEYLNECNLRFENDANVYLKEMKFQFLTWALLIASARREGNEILLKCNITTLMYFILIPPKTQQTHIYFANTKKKTKTKSIFVEMNENRMRNS